MAITVIVAASAGDLDGGFLHGQSEDVAEDHRKISVVAA
jgi:hypothetical protein